MRSLLLGFVALFGGCIALGVAKEVGSGCGKEIGGAIGRTVSDPRPLGEWTPAQRKEMHSAFLRRAADLTFAVTQDDREALASCFTAKFIAAVPGGPRQARTMRDAAVQEIGRRAGFDCAQEYAAKITASSTWVPQFPPLYVLGCVMTNGEPNRKWCECLVNEAPAQFATPATFVKVDSTSDPKVLSPEDRRRLRRVAGKCLKLHVDVGRNEITQ